MPLTIALLLIGFISYSLDKFRVLVMFMGILYCMIFCGLLAFSVILLKKKEIPFGIISVLVIFVMFQNDSINNNFICVENRLGAQVVFLTILILAIVLMVILCLGLKKAAWKEELPSFLIISILLSVACVTYGLFPMINYSFDLTDTKVLEVYVVESAGEDNLRGAFFDTHYLYQISPLDNVSLNQISIDSDYKIDNNTAVWIEYREGLFCEIYKIDYSRLARASD
jgi:hypothetical protein